MVEQLVGRFRALLGAGGADEDMEPDPDDRMAPDPEWDQLLDWAREGTQEIPMPGAALDRSGDEDEDEDEWRLLAEQAKAAAAEQAEAAAAEADEWARVIARARSVVRTAPALVPDRPAFRPAAPGIVSLSARLDRMAAQVPSVRARRAR